jgi:hypothetical protein
MELLRDTGSEALVVFDGGGSLSGGRCTSSVYRP